MSISGRTALEVEQLVCSYGGLRAVAGVTFNIQEGAFVGLIGPNGAGKSTLLDCISGRNRRYTGRVSALGSDITHMRMPDLAQMGVIRTFQVARPFAKLTVLANLMVGPRHQIGERLWEAVFGGWHAQERANLRSAYDSISRFALGDVVDNYGSELSGGQERLLELSRAVLCGPKLLLLDEPFAGVSPTNRARLARHLRSLVLEGGLSVLMVEHRLEWVEVLCNRVLVMAEGKIIADDPMDQIRKDQRVIEAYLGTA